MGDRLNPIRENYKKIDSISSWTTVKQHIEVNDSVEYLSIIYYYLNEDLLKINISHLEISSGVKQEFYLKDNQLFYVFEHRSEYIETDLNLIEEEYFFENGKLIRQINNQDCGSPLEDSFLKEEEARLYFDFEKFMNFPVH